MYSGFFTLVSNQQSSNKVKVLQYYFYRLSSCTMQQFSDHVLHTKCKWLWIIPFQKWIFVLQKCLLEIYRTHWNYFSSYTILYFTIPQGN